MKIKKITKLKKRYFQCRVSIDTLKKAEDLARSEGFVDGHGVQWGMIIEQLLDYWINSNKK
jgi:hypothetical protein